MIAETPTAETAGVPRPYREKGAHSDPHRSVRVGWLAGAALCLQRHATAAA